MSPTPFEQQVYTVLAELAIPYNLTEHPPVYTMQQAGAYDAGLPGAQCKNLFLRDKKGKRHFLAIFEAASSVDLHALGAQVGETGLGLASAQRLERILGVQAGAVGPFALLHPAASAVTVLVEARLRSSSHAGFHPNVNTRTLTLAWADFERYLRHVGNPLLWI